MILRRVIVHIGEQNWTAIALDFMIVVVGVFLGIQLINWNAAWADDARERMLLGEEALTTIYAALGLDTFNDHTAGGRVLDLAKYTYPFAF